MSLGLETCRALADKYPSAWRKHPHTLGELWYVPGLSEHYPFLYVGATDGYNNPGQNWENRTFHFCLDRGTEYQGNSEDWAVSGRAQMVRCPRLEDLLEIAAKVDDREEPYFMLGRHTTGEWDFAGESYGCLEPPVGEGLSPVEAVAAWLLARNPA